MPIEGATNVQIEIRWDQGSEPKYAYINRVLFKPAFAEPEPLKDGEWAALEKAERTLYASSLGCHAYTEVIPQDESGQIRYIWEQARSALQENHDRRWDDLGFSVQLSWTAERVARTLAVLNFGADFLLK